LLCVCCILRLSTVASLERGELGAKISVPEYYSASYVRASVGGVWIDGERAKHQHESANQSQSSP